MGWLNTLLGSAAVGVVAVAAEEIKACPTNDKVSRAGGKAKSVIFANTLAKNLDLFWVDPDNEEVVSGELLAGTEDNVHNSYIGHVFRARTQDTKRLVFEHQMEDTGKRSLLVIILPCDDEVLYKLDTTARSDEFAALIHDQAAPCEGLSPAWSCVRDVSVEEYADRWPPAYGFTAEEVRTSELRGRRDRQQIDETYVDHVDTVPQLTKGPGYLKMDIPKGLWKELSAFWETKKDKATPHEPIGGGFSNVNAQPFSKIDLDHSRGMHAKIVSEIKAVTQWWTQQKLIHTSTFGIRLYHDKASLLNHVDRGDTHLASAVLQIAQDVEVGWPLEVLETKHGLREVYLQPGEMVLYEGARILHGRPMRLNGTMFANVFTHFAPPDYGGTPTGYARNDGEYWKKFERAADEKFESVFKHQVPAAGHDEL